MANQRDRVYRVVTTAALGIGAVGMYSVLVEPHWLEVTHTRVPLPGLPAALDGLRIALLSDMHLGQGTSRRLIRRACRKAMAAEPHVITLTGDFIQDNAPGFQQILENLAELSAPLGIYAVPGNHDYRVGIETWQQQLAAYPSIVDLTNRAVVREVNGARLCIAGVDAFSRGHPRFDALPPREEVDCTILLAHNPDQAEHLPAGGADVDLILSGHTHGGQVRLPMVGALRNPARHAAIYESGLYRRPQSHVYVSRGIGTVHIPMRFLCRPEVAILELTADPSR